jgi:hypothetical protein
MTFPTYEVQENGSIKRTQADGTVHWIPADPANSDYQRYLNPEAEQSTLNPPINEAKAI